MDSDYEVHAANKDNLGNFSPLHLFRLASVRSGGGGDSLKKKGRFKVRRVRSGSREANDSGGGNEVRKEEPSPGAKVRFVEYFHPLSEFASSATTKIVAVFNVSGLFPFDRRLATQYQLREHLSAERATL